MSTFNRELAIVKRPSRAIAEKIVSSLAGDLAELMRKTQLSKDEIKELKRLRDAARAYRYVATLTTNGD
jgi:hypothetical protein